MFKVVDLETTGLNADCEIAQIAVWTMDDSFDFKGYENMYFNIHGEMPPEAYKVHHLSKSVLEEKSEDKYFDDLKDDVKDIIDGGVLVAHNAAFEKKVLTYHLGDYIMSKDWICTMLRYTPAMKLKDRRGNGGFKYCNLRELFDFIVEESGKPSSYYEDKFSLLTGDLTGFHDALYDSYCTGLALNILG